MKWILIVSISAMLLACGQSKRLASATGIGMSQIDVQGHRGCRGLMPENSIPGFLKALELGVNTLEMDVVISADRQVVVSHEPYFSHQICKDPLGRTIEKEQEESHNIFQMNLSDIQKYDCGTKVHPDFPAQLKIKTYKPSLEEVFKHVEAWISASDEKVNYNIELKRIPGYDGHFHPGPDEFVSTVLSVIQEASLEDRVMLQSFDPDCLEIAHKMAPEIRLAFLVEAGNYSDNMALLSFVPNCYSPEFSMVTADLLEQVKNDKMKIIPWTVNDPNDIARLINLGVDGIISDYPDRVITLLRQNAKF
ncbi:MAG: glycerophosphodiester phosphodiesterase [Saprospiraceae bacterium]|nr:glycerophosphodiester phosphodiesterase [Saprospiraceae bacterium]